ncbi:acyl-CoA dehydrogenase [Chromatiales bacterium (ex Bugula neritina AB1)]|nr:acyl-CoA dehydrogenase [Chromatiales bacterium (ex Bugula neritina AB1)]
MSFSKREIYQHEHELMRNELQRFLQREAVPKLDAWEAQGHADRQIWNQLGEIGVMAAMVPERYNGGGADMRMAAVIYEEIGRCGVAGLGGIGVHDIVAYYLLNKGSDELKNQWLPRATSGETLFAVAMTEPAAGSDLRGIKTHAERDGDSYIVNGSKIFITNGIAADAVAVVCRTDPSAERGGLSLILVESNSAGFKRGRNLEKMGQKSQDTAELFFEDVRVPAGNLIGELHRGLNLLMAELPFERLLIGLTALGAAKGAYEETHNYVSDRKAFGQTLATFQNTRYKLAELRTEIEVGEAFVDRCVAAHMTGELTTEQASMCKLWLTEMQDKVVDTCVQLHGGYGYMWEYSIAKRYADSRVQRIYGGTSEIMKEVISRSLPLDS